MKVGDICHLKLSITPVYGDYCVISSVINPTDGRRYYHVNWFDNHGTIGAVKWYDYELVKVDTDMTVEEYKFYLQL